MYVSFGVIGRNERSQYGVEKLANPARMAGKGLPAILARGIDATMESQFAVPDKPYPEQAG